MKQRKDKGKYLAGWIRALLALILVGVLSFCGLFACVMYGAYDHIQGEPEVMVILGCQVMADILSKGGELPIGCVLFHKDFLIKNRLTFSEDYSSGGLGPDEPTSEAQAMADYLTAHGVEEEKVLLEPDSHNTAQNLDYSRRLLDREGIDTSDGVLLVSNGFHLTRARMLAERAGFEQVSTLAAPASHLPSRLYMYVREPLALVKSFLLDR